MQFGNKDTDQKHDLSKIKNIQPSKYVVRHFNHVSLANGDKMEDPTTSRIQIYDKETFEKINAMRERNIHGKTIQVPSMFQEAGLNVDVLHDPTIEAEDPGAVVRKASDVIADIKAANTVAEVDALIIEGESRKGVLSAAEARKSELK